MDIQQAIIIARADATRIERFARRRERFLDALDWKNLSEDDVYASAMLDRLLEDDVVHAKRCVELLCNDAAKGISSVEDFHRFDPRPRPWHPEWTNL